MTVHLDFYPSSKKPNSFGLYDILGNASELTNTFDHTYQLGSFVNPTGPENGECKIFRGGFWYSGSRQLTFTRRLTVWPDDRKYDIHLGFRPVLPCFED
ncbi:MAG: formylglycine-generating enzyme family protein [Chitinispirillaceae bacterium]